MEMPEMTSGSKKEKKSPSRMTIMHDDMEGANSLAPGDEVEFHGKGHVRSNRAKDEFGDGQVDLDVHSLNHTSSKKKGRESSKNAANMPMDELKKAIQPEDEE